MTLFGLTVSTIVFWLIIALIMLIVEALTAGLTTIWFAGGALAALAACACGANILIQVIVFFVVSLVLLIFTRPLAVKYITPKRIRTNYEEAVGQTVRIVEQVDNKKETGVAVLNGQEWTARSEDESVVIPKDDFAEVVEVVGVKLIVRPKK